MHMRHDEIRQKYGESHASDVRFKYIFTKVVQVNWMTVCDSHKRNLELVGQYHLLANQHIVRILKYFFVLT